MRQISVLVYVIAPVVFTLLLFLGPSCSGTDAATTLSGAFVADYNKNDYLVQSYEQWIATVRPSPIYVSND